MTPPRSGAGWLAGLVLMAAVVAVGPGCTFAQFQGRPHTQEDTLWQVGVRSAFDVVQWDTRFSETQRTVARPRSEGGPETGSVTLSPEGAVESPRVGVLGTFGNNGLRLIVGADARVNFPAAKDDFTTPLHDHAYFPFYPNYNAYGGYELFDPHPVTAIPYVGLESIIGRRVLLGIEGGLPYGGFTWEKGYEGYGSQFATERDSWSGFGRSAKARVGLVFPEDVGYLGFSYSEEFYNARFNGVATGVIARVLGLEFELRF
jgi:hypothetical protein